ncbi:MAG: hypothetical protein ABWZ40_10250 [Caulobacterales bacterium]
MSTLFSDEELRSALESAKRRWDETLHGAVEQVSRKTERDLDIAQVKAVYHRLGCEAAQRWGLLR